MYFCITRTASASIFSVEFYSIESAKSCLFVSHLLDFGRNVIVEVDACLAPILGYVIFHYCSLIWSGLSSHVSVEQIFIFFSNTTTYLTCEEKDVLLACQFVHP